MANLTWKQSLLGSAMALSLVAAPAIAQEVTEWDQNADSSLDQQEFQSGFDGAGVFGDWDANDDDMLSQEEFTAGIGENTDDFQSRFGDDAFGEWDADDDTSLTTEEFNEGVYSGYDADESGTIEEPEFGDLGDDIGDAGFWDV
jgi:hypothetical protein